jgi:hypothetical protein
LSMEYKIISLTDLTCLAEEGESKRAGNPKSEISFCLFSAKAFLNLD